MDPVTQGLILGAAAGILVGLWPLLRGFSLNQQTLGVAGFFASVVAGAVLGMLLCIPIAWLFAWQIKKQSSSMEVVENEQENR